ncbi:putative secreted protein [Corynebacterium renale]|uniref:LGFP repeat-containing protein n=1 Tax=Corynebacterium renale TaxID=1724 RepID=A0A2A9DMF9_9CORY|nr:LGFP repeat-containing protein [Corynebacterium renale]SQI22098.1 putative secreted protein [Corynebacterium renale]
MQQKRRLTAARPKPVAATVLAAALAVTAAFGGNKILNTDGPDAGNIEVLNESVSFDSGNNVLVDDPAIATQGDGSEGTARTVKEFTREEEFSQFALTWYGERDIAAFVRAEMPDGSWSPWYDMDPQDSGYINPNGINGTELIYHEPTHKVQVSTANIDYAGAEEGTDVDLPDTEQPAEEAPVPAEAPAPVNYDDIKPVADSDTGISAVFIDGNAEEGGIAPVQYSDAYGMPKVVSRSGWGAGAKNCSVDYAEPVSAITIHHTAGSNNYTPAQSAAQMRGYWNYHANTLGWCDIGYHALVDKYGTIYEGRAGGMNKGVIGAHAGGFNSNTWAISMMGNYTTTAPSQAMLKSVGELAGWRASVAGFHPQGSGTHYSEGSSYTFVPYGQAKTLPNIFAHRDVGYTTCPGDAAYAQMGTIRSIATQKYNAINAGTAGTTTTTATTTTTPPAVSNQVTTTTTPPPAPSGTPNVAQSSAPGGLSLSGIVNAIQSGDVAAIAGVVGTIAVVALTWAVKNGHLDLSKLGLNGNTEVLGGVSLKDIPPVVDKVAAFSSDSQLSQLWSHNRGTLGHVLGAARGPVGETSQGVAYQAFDNGIMVGNEATGPRALWGAIGDAWAQQGFDLGPLGLPLNEEHQWNGLIKVDFQGGNITWNPETNEVKINR